MTVSSLFLSGVAVAIPFLLSSASAHQVSYVLDTEYSGSNFFDGFQFFTDRDPSNGYVTYVDSATALAGGLISAKDNGPAYIGVDHTSVLSTSGAGRKSIRLQTAKTFTHGLFILDASHMPGGQCGTWPAWWSYGPNWPNSGEIDVLEGVNSGTRNKMSLHSSPTCSISGLGQSGTLVGGECHAQSAGCGSDSNSANTYGAGFSSNGGGVYATEWTSSHIKIWFFPRSGIPADIASGSPDPSNWGVPEASFEGTCDINGHFATHQLVLNTNFCGDWAGYSSVWNSDATCSSIASTCVEYVALNPSAFKDAYWEINSIKVYKVDGTTIEGPTHTAPSVPTATPTAISDLPTCGQNCFNDLIGQASIYGCATGDLACLCRNFNFNNGMHDCSLGACGNAIGEYVLKFKEQWCAAAISTAVISSTTATATSPATTPSSISDLPACGQNCFNNMIGQGPTLGCPESDAACLCKNSNFQSGMHDCSLGACGPTVGAEVLAFEAKWCAAASPPSTTTASASPSPTSISTLPPCGQTCFNNLIGQASIYGCSGEDTACLCKNNDFQNGMRDCSNGACGPTVGALVLEFEAKWCAAATPPSSTTTSASSSEPTSIDTLPACGQVCFNNLIGQASIYGCSGEDTACLCKSNDFQNGMRDCSNGACGPTVGAKVLEFEAKWCAAASPPSTSTTSASNSVPTSIDSLPACGQTCFNNLIGQASIYGCSGEDTACLCKNNDFQNGMRDCSNGACGSTIGAMVLEFEAKWCAAALSPRSSTQTPSAAVTTTSSVPKSTSDSLTDSAVPASTTVLSEPTSTSGPTAPSTIGETFSYFGCFSSPDDFSSFQLQASSPDTTIDSCVNQCKFLPAKYAGVWGTECYCANTFDATAMVLAPEGSCNTPCPGNPFETCGGTMSASSTRRRQAGGKLLTVYVNNLAASGSGSPSSSSIEATSAAASSSSSPSMETSTDSFSAVAEPTNAASSSTSLVLVEASSTDSFTASAEPTNAASSSTSRVPVDTTSTDSVSASAEPTSGASSSEYSSLTETSIASSSTQVPYPYYNGTIPSASSSSCTSSSSALTTSYTISTVYATSTYTITSCAPTIIDCPAHMGKLTTETISLYTTRCPVSPYAHTTPAAGITHKADPVAYTTVIVTEYTSICPAGTLSVYTTSQTQTLYSTPGAEAPTPEISMSTMTTTLVGGETVVLHLPVATTVITRTSVITVLPVHATKGYPVLSASAAGGKYHAGNHTASASMSGSGNGNGGNGKYNPTTNNAGYSVATTGSYQPTVSPYVVSAGTMVGRTCYSMIMLVMGMVGIMVL